MNTLGTLRVATGHGIDVGHALAGLGARSYAFIIDWHIRALVATAWILTYVAIEWLVGRFDGTFDLGNAAMWVVFAPAAAIYFLYHPIYEVLANGSTPGKRMAGIRVVNQDGGYAGAGTHIMRNVFRLVDALPALYCVGIICCLFNERQLRIGDFAVGTVLVYEEHQRDKFKRAVDYHSAASTHDPRVLGLASDILARWSELEPERRRALALAVLDELDTASKPKHDDAGLKRQLRDAIDAALAS